MLRGRRGWRRFDNVTNGTVQSVCISNMMKKSKYNYYPVSEIMREKLIYENLILHAPYI